jgi:formyltetrahydrofolate dehydrogenase
MDFKLFTNFLFNSELCHAVLINFINTTVIFLQRECPVGENDTVDSLYNGFMYPEGIKAMAEAVNLVAQEKAPKITQPEEGATYDAFLNKPELCKVNLNQSAKNIHDFIRGLDSSPGKT